MSERYLKLFSLEENLYIPGSPVLIVAGALLKDMQTGRILGQLKLQSISNQEIKAATVELLPLDTTGNPLGDAVSHQYLDLTISRDDYWGSNEAILFPDASTRAYIVKVKEVIFLDNSIWSAPSVDWKALPKKILLEESLNDLELTKQYRLHFGKDCKYTYQSTPDLWYCPCGTINHREEAVCHRCKKEAAALSSVDLDLLQEEARERIKQEKEEEEAKKIAHQQRIEAQKAIWKKRMPYAILLCIVILMVTVIIPKSVEHHKQQKLNHVYAVVCDYIRENGKPDDLRTNYRLMSSNRFSAPNIDTYLSPYDFTWEVKTNKTDSSKILCTACRNFGYVDCITLRITLQPDNLCPRYTATIPRDVYTEEYKSYPADSMSSSSGDDWIFSGNIDLTSYDGEQVIIPEYLKDSNGKNFTIHDLDDGFCEDLSSLISNTVYSLEIDLWEEYDLGVSVNDLGFYSYQ